MPSAISYYLVAGLFVGVAAMASLMLRDVRAPGTPARWPGEGGDQAGAGVNARALGVVAFAAVAAATGYAVASSEEIGAGPRFRARNTL